MFGLGTWEILIILVVALIFIGPDKLPGVAKQIGKGFRQVKNAMEEVDAEVRRNQHEVYDSAREAADALKDDPPPSLLPPEGGSAGPAAGEASMTNPPPTPPTDAPASDALTTANAALEGERDWAAHAKKPVAGRVAAPPPASVAERLRPAATQAPPGLATPPSPADEAEEGQGTT